MQQRKKVYTKEQINEYPISHLMKGTGIFIKVQYTLLKLHENEQFHDDDYHHRHHHRRRRRRLSCQGNKMVLFPQIDQDEPLQRELLNACGCVSTLHTNKEGMSGMYLECGQQECIPRNLEELLKKLARENDWVWRA